jgi:soluble lytic murein transglycosylase-like protein
MTKQELANLAQQIATTYSLSPELVCAVCEQESDWDTWATRYEPGFLSRYVAPLFTNNKIDATEAHCRAISWGLMQVMGQTAREHGFHGRFLSALCDPETGLAIGCAVLAHKLSAASDVRSALLLWNGGADPEYPTQVLNRMQHYAAAAKTDLPAPDRDTKPISA